MVRGTPIEDISPVDLVFKLLNVTNVLIADKFGWCFFSVQVYIFPASRATDTRH